MKKHLLYILIALASFSLHAQNEMRVVGKGEYLPSELIDKSIRDANGEVCAGLMISTDLVGLTYTSYNNIVKVNKNTGKDLIFLSPDERVVEVYCSGFSSLKIMLNDFGINLKSGEVWKLKVTGDKTTDLIPISIVVKPSDVNIFIDEKPKGSAPSQQVSPGEHQLRIEKKGYKAISEKINVTVSNILFSYTLQQVDLVFVQINSTPNGAKIFLDGMEKGETPKGWFQFPGTYALKISKSGYFDSQQTIEIKENEKNVFSFSPIKNTGSFSFTVIPSDAVVAIDGERISEKNVELKPGSYSIKISKQNYFVLEDTIAISLSDSLQRSYSLKKNFGELKLDIDPPDAKVLINNEDHYMATNNNFELPPGLYKIEILKENYYPSKESVEIQLGKVTTKKFTLREKIGALGLSVIPDSATVTLSKNKNVIKTWKGSKIQRDLIIGKYDIEVKADGYKTLTKKLQIEEDKTINEEIRLTEGNDEPNTTLFIERDKLFKSERKLVVTPNISYNFGATKTQDFSSLTSIATIGIALEVPTYFSGWVMDLSYLKSLSGGTDEISFSEFELNGFELGLFYRSSLFEIGIGYASVKMKYKYEPLPDINDILNHINLNKDMNTNISFVSIPLGMNLSADNSNSKILFYVKSYWPIGGISYILIGGINFGFSI